VVDAGVDASVDAGVDVGLCLRQFTCFEQTLLLVCINFVGGGLSAVAIVYERVHLCVCVWVCECCQRQRFCLLLSSFFQLIVRPLDDVTDVCLICLICVNLIVAWRNTLMLSRSFHQKSDLVVYSYAYPIFFNCLYLITC